MVMTDVVVIGAGPCGLFQVFELGLQGLNVVVVDSLEQPGGQCINLYPDKPIYDIPGLPEISGKELTDNLIQQIEPFNADFYFNQSVQAINGEAGAFEVITSSGLTLHCKAIVIATGAGVFKPVKLKLDGVDQLVDRSIFYHVRNPELHRGKQVVILGGGDSALDWAITLKDIAASVTLIHRSDRFRAHPASIEKMRQSCASQEMLFFQGRVVDILTEENALRAIKVSAKDGVVRRAEVDHLLVFFGMSPNSKAYENWGIEQQYKQIKVDTERFQTSRTGIYAVGDINWYPGKRKLILSGFHEAALASFAIKEQLVPGKKAYLQYTTTSPLMHERLHVHPDVSDLLDQE